MTQKEKREMMKGIRRIEASRKNRPVKQFDMVDLVLDVLADMMDKEKLN